MIVLVLALVGAAVAAPPVPPIGDGSSCGYKSCTEFKPGFLNVHIVPHTHDDVGWLKTVDQYYYGNRNDIQKAGVQYILDSVVKELWEDPQRRFIYVETAFFHKWWVRQTPETQAKVHTLVSQGRLKFVGGAWSMNDEATTHYQSTIDQFTWGLKFLNDTFGECGRPHIGWQIDPFGHSKEFASLIRGMGFDALFLGRIDYQDKQNRIKTRTMEFEWQVGAVPDASTKLFTHALYNTYSPPPGFCFDVLCNDEPIIDDKRSPDYNVDHRVNDFLKYVRNMGKRGGYSSKNVLVTMGGDFTYQDAGMWFSNMDRLIEHGNRIAAEKYLNISLYYSTPDCYYDAVRKSKSRKPLSVKTDDFFPYASDPHSYWTGYFTSRPTVKYLEAQTNKYMQMVKQLQVLADLPKANMEILDELKSTMGVLQHHDAITGTEKQHVTYDYVRMTSKAVTEAHSITTQALNKIMFGVSAGLKFDRCQFNESSCVTSENAKGNLIVTVYNPLAWTVTAIVRVPTQGETYVVHDPEVSTPLKAQSIELFNVLNKIPSRKSKATHETLFLADVKGLGFKTLYLERTKAATKRDARKNKKEEAYDTFVTYFDDIKVMRDNIGQNVDIDELNQHNDSVDKNGDAGGVVKASKPKKVTTEKPYAGLTDDEVRMLGDDPMIVQRYSEEVLGDEATTNNSTSLTLNGFNLLVDFYTYPGFMGNNMVYENRSSGAYIFRPSADPGKLKVINMQEINGEIVNIRRYEFENNAAIESRSYKDIKLPVIEWQVGPIPADDGIGKEYVIKYSSGLTTNGEFSTDSNGRQVLKRKLGERPTWNLTLEEHAAGNYYPIVDLVYIQGNSDTFLVMPDRPEGGASLEEGVLELMVHRRLLHDDAFGVSEPLNETEAGKGLVVKGTHTLNLVNGNPDFKDVISVRMSPEIFISDAAAITLDVWRRMTNRFSWLKSLPAGVHLLTLEPFGDGSMVMRLENYLEASQNSTVDLDLYEILNNVKIKSVKETLLAADRWAVKDAKETENSFQIKLKAKDIRTFLVEYQYEK